MILVALRTGMRHGELIGAALAGRRSRRRADHRSGRTSCAGKIGTPKSGKPREIPLGDDVRAALKAHRHLRGPLVFCDMGGKMLTDSDDSKRPLWRACKKAAFGRSAGTSCGTRSRATSRCVARR